MARPASVLVAIAVLLAGCMGGDDAPAVSATEAPPRLVLRQADVPAVFVQFDRGRLLAADFTRGPRSSPVRFGRVNGWKSRYRRPGSSATRGPLVIESRLDLFEQTDGAEADLDAYRAQFAETIEDAGGRGEIQDVPSLGAEAVALSLVEPGTPDVRFFTVAWRVANVSASVSVNGFDGKLTLDHALELARVQQNRIAAASG